MFEIVSAENIYNIKKDTNIKGYIVLVEIIFCFTRSIFCLIGYFINDIKIILYISIVLIFIISFIKRKEVKRCILIFYTFSELNSEFVDILM